MSPPPATEATASGNKPPKENTSFVFDCFDGDLQPHQVFSERFSTFNPDSPISEAILELERRLPAYNVSIFQVMSQVYYFVCLILLMTTSPVHRSECQTSTLSLIDASSSSLTVHPPKVGKILLKRKILTT